MLTFSDGFRLEELAREFDLAVRERSGLFASVANGKCSDRLRETLAETIDLAVAINSEKARSELIVAPILLELRRQFQESFSLFSGVEFVVDPDRGLGGVWDFLASKSPERLFVRAPVITIVEAKNDNLKNGLGQCGAEMLAAQIFNQRENNDILTVYGTVTNGTVWRFLHLRDRVLEIDLSEYYIADTEKIIGILSQPWRDIKSG